jgi:hypothetical protein
MQLMSEGTSMSEFSKKCTNSMLAGAMVVSPIVGNVGLYCAADDLCRPEVADLAHVHQQERNQWDPAPRLTVVVTSSTTAATAITPMVLWRIG